MNVVVIYESMGGNTRRAAELIGGASSYLGAAVEVCPITKIDLHALARADLAFFGSWTDGLFFVGQRPGRAGRFKGLPCLDGMRVVPFCTYAVNPGATVSKLGAILERRGAFVLDGGAFKRSDIDNAHLAPFVADTFEALAAEGR